MISATLVQLIGRLQNTAVQPDTIYILVSRTHKSKLCARSHLQYAACCCLHVLEWQTARLSCSSLPTQPLHGSPARRARTPQKARPRQLQGLVLPPSDPQSLPVQALNAVGQATVRLMWRLLIQQWLSWRQLSCLASRLCLHAGSVLQVRHMLGSIMDILRSPDHQGGSAMSIWSSCHICLRGQMPQDMNVAAGRLDCFEIHTLASIKLC